MNNHPKYTCIISLTDSVKLIEGLLYRTVSIRQRHYMINGYTINIQLTCTSSSETRFLVSYLPVCQLCCVMHVLFVFSRPLFVRQNVFFRRVRANTDN